MVKIQHNYDTPYIWTGLGCIGSENTFLIWCELLTLGSAYLPKDSAPILHGGQHGELRIVVSITNPKKALAKCCCIELRTEQHQRASFTPAILDLCISQDSFLVDGRKGISSSLAWRCPVDCSSYSSESLLPSECTKPDQNRRGNDLFQVWKREGPIPCWWAVPSWGDGHAVRYMTERRVTL